MKVGGYDCLLLADSDAVISERPYIDLNTNCTAPDLAAGRYNLTLSIPVSSSGWGNALYDNAVYTGTQGYSFFQVCLDLLLFLPLIINDLR